MWNHVGVVRSEESLARAAGLLHGLEDDLSAIGLAQKSWVCNPELAAYLEAENMILVGQAVARSASVRKASLGAHHMQGACSEERDTDLPYNVLIRRHKGTLKAEAQPAVGEGSVGQW
jgi:succinate dehydrogenase/fumarate reductase flavoprotein subunit